MVDSPDADLVSRTLETCLRTQWSDVTREGSAIVLRGLGPTHRINRNDRAVFEVRPADEGRTAIEADVTYLASALVGDAAPQNELVQRKLDGVLELVRMDIDLARRRASQANELKPRLVNKGAAAAVAEVPEAAVAAPLPLPAEERRQSADLVEDDTLPYLPPVADVATPEPDAASDHFATYAVLPPPDAVIEPQLVHRTEDAEVPETEGKSRRTKPERAKDRSLVKIFATLLVVFVLAGVVEEGWLHRAQLNQQTGDWRSRWSESASDTVPGAPVLTPEQKAAVQLAAREAAAADAESAAEAAKLAEPDPKKWLANWADALKGQDAGAQAAFYADQVEKYFLRTDVSRADIMAAQQEAIHHRGQTWTLTLDDVVVAQQTDTTARILLVKHLVTDSGTGKVEQRLPTQIRLKRIDGEWRIVSEQTLG